MPLTRCHTWPSHGAHAGAATLPSAAAPKSVSSEEDSGTNEEEVLVPLDADIIRQQVSQIQQLHAQSNHHYRHHRRHRHLHHNGHHRSRADAAALEKTIRTQIPLQTTAAAVLPVLVLANGGGEGAVERAADLVSGATAAGAAGRRRRAGSPVLALDSRKKTTLGRHYYPEGGWGWVVITCSIVVHLLGHGLQLAWPVMQGPASAKFTIHISHTGQFHNCIFWAVSFWGRIELLQAMRRALCVSPISTV